MCGDRVWVREPQVICPAPVLEMVHGLRGLSLQQWDFCYPQLALWTVRSAPHPTFRSRPRCRLEKSRLLSWGRGRLQQRNEHARKCQALTETLDASGPVARPGSNCREIYRSACIVRIFPLECPRKIIRSHRETSKSTDAGL